MVFSCQAEEAVQAHFDALLRQRVPVEVGVVVGKPGVGSRDLLLTVIKTPDQDGQPVASVSASAAVPSATKPRKGGAGRPAAAGVAAIALEGEWVAEHCLQVARMLPGGLAVLGLYLFAPESCWAAATGPLCAALGAINDHARAGAAAAPESPPLRHLLLLFVDSATRKQALKAAPAGGAGAPAAAALTPAELKYGPWLGSLVCLRCTYALDVTLPAASSAAQLTQLASDAVAAEAAAVGGAAATLTGRLPPGDARVGDVVAADATAAAAQRVDLFPQAAAAAAAAAAPAGDWPRVEAAPAAAGTARLRGEVAAVAYAHRRESVAQALAALKADVVRSLMTRVDLLAEEALNAADEEQQANGGDSGGGDSLLAEPAHPLLATAGAAAATALALPSRVLLPWVGGLLACDYLSPGEGLGAAAARAEELLGADLGAAGAAAVVRAEALGVVQPAAVLGKPLVAGGPRGGAGAAACGGPLVAGAAAAAVLLAAMALGYSALAGAGT